MGILLVVYVVMFVLSIFAMRKVNPGEAINDVLFSLVWPVTVIFYSLCWIYRGADRIEDKKLR